VRSTPGTGFSTGVAKKELGIANLVVEKAAKLDRDTFGVTVGQGPWQRRLEETGGIKPLTFGQFGFGEMGPGLEALIAGVAKPGADEIVSAARRDSASSHPGRAHFSPPRRTCVCARRTAAPQRCHIHVKHLHADCRLAVFDEIPIRHGGGGQLQVARQWVWRRWGA
jgi:hypothetical protein